METDGTGPRAAEAMQTHEATRSTGLQWPGPIVDLVNSAMVALDRQLRVVWANKPMFQLFQFDAGHIVGRSWLELVPPMRQRLPLYDRCLSGETLVIEETGVEFPEGPRFFDVRYAPLRDETGDVVGLLASGQEVTERVRLKRQLEKRMEELENINAELRREVARRENTDRMLTEQKETLQTVFDNIPVMLTLFDENGRIELINKECEQVLGWNLEEWRSRDLLTECYPNPTERQKVVDFMTEAAPRWAEFKTRARDGRVLDTAWYSVRLATGRNIGISQDITEQRHLEREMLEIEQTLQQRIGRDLHDDLGQSLVAIAYMLDQLRHGLTTDGSPRVDDVVRIREHVADTMNHTRVLARDLAPVAFVGDDLQVSLEELAVRVQSLFDVSCTLECSKPAPDVGPEAATHLYRIAQEAINNAIKHGAAKNVTLRLSADRGRGCLTIEDDGAGVSGAVDETKGFGIRLMRYRAGVIGASVDLRRRPEGGCAVRVYYP